MKLVVSVLQVIRSWEWWLKVWKLVQGKSPVGLAGARYKCCEFMMWPQTGHFTSANSGSPDWASPKGTGGVNFEILYRLAICICDFSECLGSNYNLQFNSVQFSHSVMSQSLWPHELQHAKPPYPSPTPRVHPNPCPLSLVMPSHHLILCHPLLLLRSISPSIRVFSNESALHISGQSLRVSASTSVLPMNPQHWSPLGWTGWISLQSKGLSRVFSNTTVQKHQFFSTQLSSQSNSHTHTWSLE